MMGWLLVFDDGRHRWEMVADFAPQTVMDHIWGHVRWRRVAQSEAAGVAAFYPAPDEVPA